jgi:hypothetical protein
LANYCDLLLKKSSKNPEEAELEDPQIEPQQRDNTSTTNGEMCTHTKSTTNT